MSEIPHSNISRTLDQLREEYGLSKNSCAEHLELGGMRSAWFFKIQKNGFRAYEIEKLCELLNLDFQIVPRRSFEEEMALDDFCMEMSKR